MAYRSLVALFGLLLVTTDARPLVRNIKDEREFNKLLKHHADTTGLPVIADFYSESCGPCRMMAPIFKKVAKEYEGRAVFVKVDTARNRQLQSTYRVSSIPTFIFFGADGKRKKDFSGAGEQQLRSYTKEAAADAARLNVKLPLSALEAYYAVHDPAKPPDQVAALHAKCAKQSKGAGGGIECAGGAAADLATKLRKKYRKAPELAKRLGGEEGDGGAGGGGTDGTGTGGGDAEPAPGPGPTRQPARQQRQQRGQGGGADPAPAPAVPEGPNLELATLAELEAAVGQRRRDLGLPPVGELGAGGASGGGGNEYMGEAGDDAYDDDDDEEEEEDEEEEDLKPAWTRHQEGSEPERVAIIGSGPAGLSAAIYAARAGLKPVVLAPPFGGQLMGKGVDVENFPGLLDQTGPGVVTLMLQQATKFGTVYEEQEVVRVDLSSGSPFTLTTNTSTLRAHALIVATGADSRWLGAPGEWDFRGGGVSTCATCDGFLYRDQPVVVVGGGDTAMEDALVLARTSSSVTLVHRRGAFRASKAMAERVLAHPKITVLWHTAVVRFQGTSGTEEAAVPAEADAGGEEEGEGFVSHHPRLESVVVRSTLEGGDGSETTISCTAAFVAIGHVPNTKLFAGQLAMGDDGYLHLPGGGEGGAGGATATSVEGVFAAGDVADHVYRQAVTSAGSGAMAALDAERWLSAKGVGMDPAPPSVRSEL